MSKILNVLVTTIVFTIGICLLIYLFVEGVWYQWKDIFHMAWLQRTAWIVIAVLTFVNVGFLIWSRQEDEFGEEVYDIEDVSESVARTTSKLLDFLGQTTNWADLKSFLNSVDRDSHYCDSKGFDKDQQVMFSEERDMRDRMNGVLGSILSEDFAEMGDEDRHLLERQAVAMMLYYGELFGRCLRYGVIRENEEGE